MGGGHEKHAIKTYNTTAADDGEQMPLTNTVDVVEKMKNGSPAEHAASLESLMQEQAADTTAVTVDEDAHNHPPQYHPIPPTTIHVQEQLPLNPHLLPAQPLQLVYLQPTPHGVNIIPIQATGQPSFTSFSPPGFPAHPHHPVVVQPGLPFPLQHPTYYPSPYPVFPQLTPTTHHPCYHGPGLLRPVAGGAPILHDARRIVSTPSTRQQFFRPWEDAAHPHSNAQAVLCPHTDCGGEGGQHSQAGPETPPYSEEDFPALTKQLSKMKIKK